MREVNADLYDFLLNHETGIYYSYKNHGIEAWVHIPFDEIQNLVDIAGVNSFDCGGVDCLLQEDNICIDIIDFIEAEGHLLSSYKNCFNKDDWNNCEKLILKSEED